MNEDNRDRLHSTNSDSCKQRIGLVISIIELACSFALILATLQIGCAANQIAEQQTTISEKSQTPEFAYLGPEELHTVPSGNYIISNNEGNYGIKPRFAKVSGFADDISTSAHMYYELTITSNSNTTDQSNRIAPIKRYVIPIELYITNHSSQSQVLLENGATIISTTESGSEDINFSTLANELKTRGYTLNYVKAYFVETISFTDIVGEPCEKTYYITHPDKSRATPEFLLERTAEKPIIVTGAWNQPNRGLGQTAMADLADRCVKKMLE